MATVVKDFKIKSGLVVEGANATVGGYDVLTKKEDDQDYIIDLIGGTATPDNTPSTVVKRDASGNFAAGTITADLAGDVTGNADTATALETARTIELTGDVTGEVLFDGTSNVQIQAVIDGDFATDAEVATAKGEAIDAAEAYTDTELGTHNSATTGVHGVTGAVVGTSDSQTLTNKTLGAGTNLSVALDMNGNKIEDLGTPTAGTDATTKNYVDAGDTATLGSANSYTDDEITALDTSLKAYADQAESDAISSAASAAAALYAPLAGATFTGDVILPGDPTQALGAATKQYVDAVAEGLHVHASAVAATTANVDLATGGLLTIDGVGLNEDERVLVKDQSNATQNGIYLAKPGAWVRADDYNSAAEIQGGDFTFVTGGNTYASTGWVQTNTVTTLGTSTINFDQFSGAGEYVAGTGLVLNGNSFAIDDTVTATKSYVDGEISDLDAAAQGYAADAEVDAKAYTDQRENAITTAYQGYADNAEADAKLYTDQEISALNTDDIEEGLTNEYFTDARAKGSAADLLVNANKTNITITGNEDGLTITAENGVADSNTDDLVEGLTNKYFTPERAVSAIADVINGGTQTNISVSYNSGSNKIDFVAENGVADSTTNDLAEGTGPNANLYFTDARAVAALEAVVPNFDEIDINSIATQVAAASSGDAAQSVVAYSFAAADYRSAKFLVKVAHGSHTEVSEVLLTLDSSDNIAITEYAVVGTNGSASAITADVSNGNVRLLVTPTNNGSTIKVMGTLLV
jgi:hypothetical protein